MSEEMEFKRYFFRKERSARFVRLIGLSATGQQRTLARAHAEALSVRSALLAMAALDLAPQAVEVADPGYPQGRPTLGQNARTATITVAVTEAQKTAIKSAARAAKTSQSAWCAAAITAALEPGEE